jgi:hypothetical protein
MHVTGLGIHKFPQIQMHSTPNQVWEKLLYCIHYFIVYTRLHFILQHCILLYKFFSLLPNINPLKVELNPICHLLALLGVHHILHVSGIRVNITY